MGRGYSPGAPEGADADTTLLLTESNSISAFRAPYSAYVTLIASFRSLRSALPVIAVASALAAVGAVPTPATAAAPPRAGRPAATSGPDQLAVLHYWTPARMADAVPFGPLPRLPTLPTLPALPPLPGLTAPSAGALALGTPAEPEFMSAQAAQAEGAPWPGGGAVARTTGRVFFTLNGADYSCSGSTVASANADVVLTAAHCVNGGAGSWATNWTFIPGYNGGNAPYGAYTARDFYVDDHWTYANVSYDFAFVALNTAKVSGVTTHAVTAAGGQPIRFGPQPAQEDIFGYPAEPPFTGDQLDYCSGPTAPDPNGGDDDDGVDCGMTEGDSGGPWLSGFNPRTGTGTITSVSSFKYDTNNRTLYGPELGSAAESLYNQAQHA